MSKLKRTFEIIVGVIVVVVGMNIIVVSAAYAASAALGRLMVGGTVTSMAPVVCGPVAPPPPLMCGDWVVTLSTYGRGRQVMLVGPLRPPVIGRVRKGGGVFGFGVSVGPYIQPGGMMFGF